MVDENDESATEGANQALDRGVYAAPAIYANKFLITISGPNTRIGFAEQSPMFSEQMEPRGAFLLTTENAIEMASLILRLHSEMMQNAVEEKAPET